MITIMMMMMMYNNINVEKGINSAYNYENVITFLFVKYKQAISFIIDKIIIITMNI